MSIATPAYPNITFRQLVPEHERALGGLHHKVFGPGRFARTAFRIRERVAPCHASSWLAFAGDDLIGALIMTPVTCCRAHGYLLGPIAVEEDWRASGIGGELMQRALRIADETSAHFTVLVGDPPFYQRHDFAVADIVDSETTLKLPGPADPARTLVRVGPHGGDAPMGALRPRRLPAGS